MAMPLATPRGCCGTIPTSPFRSAVDAAGPGLVFSGDKSGVLKKRIRERFFFRLYSLFFKDSRYFFSRWDGRIRNRMSLDPDCISIWLQYACLLQYRLTRFFEGFSLEEWKLVKQKEPMKLRHKYMFKWIYILYIYTHMITYESYEHIML